MIGLEVTRFVFWMVRVVWWLWRFGRLWTTLRLIFILIVGDFDVNVAVACGGWTRRRPVLHQLGFVMELLTVRQRCALKHGVLEVRPGDFCACQVCPFQHSILEVCAR